MKYCINCGSPLEEHNKFCFKCGTPVEGDGVFYEEEFYLPKKLERKYKIQPLEAAEGSKGKSNRQIAVAVMIAGVLILFLTISGVILYKTVILTSRI